MPGDGAGGAAAAPPVIDVYIDMKSPHAFLAVLPTLDVERDYHCLLRWLPFELSYVDIGVSTEVGPDMVRRPPSAHGDRRARMYYRAAREYARLQGVRIRGPARLLDSRRANMGMLWAARQGRAAEYALDVFRAGWPSGWRDYDMEDPARLAASLRNAGAGADGFAEWLRSGAARDEYDAAQRAAVRSGAVGVPHYSLDDGGRHLGLFGREHLALIRGKLHARGLARRPGVTPDVSHAWRPAAAL